MKLHGVKLLVVSGLCALAIQLAGCDKEKKSEASDTAKKSDTTVVKVVISEVKESAFEDWRSYSADLRGSEDAYLTAPYQGGRVNSVKKVGIRVKAGESLCDINGTVYEAALEAAKAQVEVAKGDLERARINVEKGSLGRSVIDAANLAFQNARMNLANAQRAYEDCRCEAPFDGVLVSRSIDAFQMVGPGTQTVRLSRLDKLQAIIAIPETEAFSFNEGMETEFRLLQNQNEIYKGRIQSIDRAVDSRSRTANARIDISNIRGALKPGMVGRARILRKVYNKAIVVPSTALLRLQNGIFAMVVENGVAVQKSVNVEITDGENVLIKNGLNAGDLLIVSGAFQVSNGTKVIY
jgi:membrane fusion protein (multidrug efflux system)